MNEICEACALDPASHSFKKIKEQHNHVLYYTNPSRAKLYNDTKGILTHYDNALKTLGNKKWSWIFDSDGFDWRHAMEIQTGIGLAKLITSTYRDKLEKITIINPTWHIHVMLMVVLPFLSEDILYKITILTDRYYSVVEFV
jgi:hypothetical protein